MLLREFISETLSQIIEGVADAQKRAGELDAYINPPDTNKRRVDQPNALCVLLPGPEQYLRLVQTVEFDVAVTTMEAGTNKLAGGFLAVVSIGATKETAGKTEAISRIKFSVPLVLPQQKVLKKSATPPAPTQPPLGQSPSGVPAQP